METDDLLLRVCERCNDSPQLMVETEVNRMRGNNYDIVTYESVYECPKCTLETRVQDTIRECVSTMDSMTDEQNLTQSPARFGT